MSEGEKQRRTGFCWTEWGGKGYFGLFTLHSQPNSRYKLTEWTEVLDREQKFRWYSHGEVFEFGCYRGKSKFYGCYIENFLIEI